MHNLLSKVFEKKGIKNVEDLTKEEQGLFDTYQRILSKEKIEVEDIRAFIHAQLDIIESKWRDYEMPQARKAELIPYHTVYKSLLRVITSPLVERENLEKYLINLLHS